MAPPKIKNNSKSKPNFNKTKNKNKPKGKKKQKQKAALIDPGKKVLKKHKWSEVRELKTKKSVKNKKNDVNTDESNNVPEDITQSHHKPSKSPNPKRSVKQSVPEVKESLRDRMQKRLEAARFRQINEELDSTANDNPVEAFGSNPEVFQKYHDAYKGRMEHWPNNPLNVIIKWVKKKFPKGSVIADFGCGEARLSLAVPDKTVHSFDLFALNERVTACDMSKVPLEDGSVDAAVFCLSLMGTDVSRFIAEANRVLKMNGLLKIAEVSSRFSGNTFEAFLKRMKKFGFGAKQKGQKSHDAPEGEDDVFLMFEFIKIRQIKSLGKLPSLKLSPSVYKKR